MKQKNGKPPSNPSLNDKISGLVNRVNELENMNDLTKLIVERDAIKIEVDDIAMYVSKLKTVIIENSDAIDLGDSFDFDECSTEIEQLQQQILQDSITIEQKIEYYGKLKRLIKLSKQYLESKKMVVEMLTE